MNEAERQCRAICQLACSATLAAAHNVVLLFLAEKCFTGGRFWQMILTDCRVTAWFTKFHLKLLYLTLLLPPQGNEQEKEMGVAVARMSNGAGHGHTWAVHKGALFVPAERQQGWLISMSSGYANWNVRVCVCVCEGRIQITADMTLF